MKPQNKQGGFLRERNIEKMQEILRPVSLFDTKTKTGLYNVYDQVDWQVVEES